uniref:Uncharacterized protein n=1 Tax=Nelumbo nucifera TaxID=4432 RepID=A0A822YY44_NELNU|nr:TPA_asm: hypothetical protein HUJ06_006745 [Nelumbo nucifera]
MLVDCWIDTKGYKCYKIVSSRIYGNMFVVKKAKVSFLFSYISYMRFYIEIACFPRVLQSSCTKPDRQAENAYIQNMQDQLQPKRRSASPVSDSHIQKHGGCIDQNLLVHENRTEGMMCFLVFMAKYCSPFAQSCILLILFVIGHLGIL